MRNIVSTWFRDGEVIRRLSYTKIDFALPRLTGHVLLKAEPGDVIELTHRETEMHLGTIKVRLGGIDTDYVWDRPLPKTRR